LPASSGPRNFARDAVKIALENYDIKIAKK
jgi:hypothetical protein